MQHRFEVTRSPSDLQSAITATYDILSLNSDDPLSRATDLTGLTECLLCRFAIAGTRNDLNEALKLQTEAVDILKWHLGVKNIETQRALHTLGQVHHDLGNFKRAAGLYRDCWVQRKKMLGAEHCDIYNRSCSTPFCYPLLKAKTNVANGQML